MADEPKYEVYEKTYSWGTLVELFKNDRRIMVIDIYNNDTYFIHGQA